MPDAAVALGTSDAAAPQARAGQRFYIGFGIFVILLSLAGFAPSLIDQSRRFAPPTTLLMVHGATALAWLLLYVTQTLLVARGRVDLHRRVGWAGPMFAALLVLFGYCTTVDGAFRASDLSGDVTRLMVEPGSPPLTEAERIVDFWATLGVLLNFSVMVAAGILFRRRAELHKRLMVFALLPLGFESLLHLGGTLVARLPLSRGTLAIGTLLVVLAVHFIPAVHDKLTRGRVHPASV